MDKRPSHISTFSGGMDKDISFPNLPKEKYYELKNGRVVVTNYSNGFSISPFKQPEQFFQIANEEETGLEIIGSILIRNGEEFQLIIFTKSDYGDKIWYITDLETTPIITLLWSGDLNFNRQYIIDGVSKYETPNNIKIYWWDNINQFRYCNIKDINISSFTPDKFDNVPDAILEQPTFDSIISGSMKSGKIQYAYRVYNNNGSVSNISPFSGMIHLVGPGISETNTSFNYIGANYDVTTDRGVRMLFSNLPLTTDRIKVYSIHYTQANSLPTVKLVADASHTGSFTLSDTGELPGSLEISVDELIFENYIPIPKTGITKHNTLFFGNIDKVTFDNESIENFDCRAYRFKLQSGNFKYLHLGGDNGYDGIINNLSELGNISVKADAKQEKIYQKSTGLGGYDYRYKYNGGGILGGSGLNIEYEFFITQQNIAYNANSNYQFKEAQSGTLLNNIQYSNNYPTNNTVSNSSSVALDYTMGGYCRDEVYPFAIVFTDTKGFKSFPKWIADIKMPAMSENDSKKTYNNQYNFNIIDNNASTNDKYIANYLGIKFTLNNISTLLTMNPDIVSWEIVRMNRTKLDRSIVYNGYLFSLYNVGSNYYLGNNYNVAGIHYTALSTTEGLVSSEKSNYKAFVTPEYFIENNTIDFSSGDKLSYLASFNQTITPNAGTTPVDTIIQTAQHNVLSNTSPTEEILKEVSCPYNQPVQIDTAETLGPFAGGAGYLNMRGSVITLKTKNPIKWYTEDLYMYNIERDNDEAYGGNTYNSRFNRIYYSTMNTVKIDQTNLTNPQSITVLSGDTYINYFEYLASMFGYTNEPTYSNRRQSFLIAPVESTYNLELRSGYYHLKRDPNITYVIDPAGFKYNPTHVGVQVFLEKAGIYPAGDWTSHNINDCYFEQPADFYTYNTVYSQYPTIPSYIPAPELFDYKNEFDARIVYSNTKITGETEDSWLVFEPLNFKDLDYEYGPINQLIKLKDNVYSLQSRAFSALSINPRVALSVDSGVPVQLGSGSKLERFDYISTKYGSYFRFGATASENGLYFLDSFNKKLMLYSGDTSTLSDIKGMYSYFNKEVPDSIFTSDLGLYGMTSLYHDIKNNNIVIYFNYYSYNKLILFNELLKGFESINSLNTASTEGLFIPTNSQYYIGKGRNVLKYDSIYDPLIETELTCVINSAYEERKVFDNLYFDIDIYNEDGNKDSNYVHTSQLFNISDFIKSIKYYNDYQNTGDIQPIIKTGLGIPYNHNMSRVEREYQYQIQPNDVIDVSASILDPLNTYTGSGVQKPTFRDRMRGKYVICKIKLTPYNDTISSSPGMKIFSLNYLKTLFRISY